MEIPTHIYIALQVVAQIVGKFKVTLDFIVPTERARITLFHSPLLPNTLDIESINPFAYPHQSIPCKLYVTSRQLPISHS